MKRTLIALWVPLVLLLAACHEQSTSENAKQAGHAESRAPETQPAEKIAEEAVLLTNNAEQLQLIEQYRAFINSVDLIYRTNPENIELYMKLSGSDSLVRVKNFDNAPESLETSFNVYRDSTGGVRYVLESPFSASGDRMLTFVHYFAENGNTLAFVRTHSFMDSTCAEGPVYEISAYFFDQEQKLIQKTYELKDDEGNALRAVGCKPISREQYRIFRNRNDLSKAVTLPASVPALPGR